MRNMSRLGFGVLGQLQAAASSSAMAADASALYWFDPDNGVTESAGSITAWADNTGNGVDLAQVGSEAVPGWDAGGFTTFDGTARGLSASAQTATAMAELDGGGEVAVFAVVQLDSGVSGAAFDAVVLCEGDVTNPFSNQALSLVIGHNDADATNTDVRWRNKRFSNAFDIDVNSGADLRGTKIILEAVATQTNAEIFIDGSSISSATPTTADFADDATTGVSLGVATNGTTLSSQTFDGNIYEVFVTADASTSNRNAIRSELATIHGITL